MNDAELTAMAKQNVKPYIDMRRELKVFMDVYRKDLVVAPHGIRRMKPHQPLKDAVIYQLPLDWEIPPDSALRPPQIEGLEFCAVSPNERGTMSLDYKKFHYFIYEAPRVPNFAGYWYWEPLSKKWITGGSVAWISFNGVIYDTYWNGCSPIRPQYVGFKT